MCTKKRDLDAPEAEGLYPSESLHCELVLSSYPTVAAPARGTRALQVSPDNEVQVTISSCFPALYKVARANARKDPAVRVPFSPRYNPVFKPNMYRKEDSASHRVLFKARRSCQRTFSRHLGS